jgi:hypothetical protein
MIAKCETQQQPISEPNHEVSLLIRLAVFLARDGALMKLQRNGFDFIFLDRIYRIDGIFSPSARSPFGRRPFYPHDPVDPVQFSFKDENPFLIFGLFLSSLFYVSFLIKLATFQAIGCLHNLSKAA